MGVRFNATRRSPTHPFTPVIADAELFPHIWLTPGSGTSTSDYIPSPAYRPDLDLSCTRSTAGAIATALPGLFTPRGEALIAEAGAVVRACAAWLIANQDEPSAPVRRQTLPGTGSLVMHDCGLAVGAMNKLIARLGDLAAEGLSRGATHIVAG